MRSKVATRIQNETPREVRLFVRYYTALVVWIQRISGKKGSVAKKADR